MNEFDHIPMIYLLNTFLKFCWTREISVIELLKLNINFMNVTKNINLGFYYLRRMNTLLILQLT